MPPTLGNGKICYLEIPAADITKSAEFYRTVFGWNIRKRGDGSVAFDDGVGEVSGTWVLGRPPQGDSGILVYMMVDSVAATADAIVANGGAIVQQTPGKGQECTATFRDPAGNLMGIGQQ